MSLKQLNIWHCAVTFNAAASHEFMLPLGHCPKSQGMKQLMAGGGVALIGLVLVPLLSGLFG